jgi:hypothetical protein
MNLNMDNENQGKIMRPEAPVVLHAKPVQTGEDSLGLAGTYNAIKRLNRNTTWIAIGLLAPVAFAVMMAAVQGPRTTVDDLTQKAKQTTGNLLPRDNADAISNLAGSNEKSTKEIISGQATSVDNNLARGTNQSAVQANATSWSPAQRPDPAGVVPSKIRYVRQRSTMRPRRIDVKMRLIELWHRSLARTKKSPSWTLLSNTHGVKRTKVSYTVETRR